MMSKLTLRRLGTLCKAIDYVFEEWVKSNYKSQEAQLKLTLFNKIKKNLEEQKRGFLKSKVKYSVMADYIGKNYKESYGNLYKNCVKNLI